MSLGSRIRLARKANEMSMRALAEMIGISAMAISKYEKGKMNPSSEVLINLAKALSVKVEYFFRPAPEDVSLVLFRKHANLDKKNQEAIHAKILEWLERYLEIESLLDLGDPGFDMIDKFTIMDLQEVEEAAKQVRNKWGLGFDPIENLIDELESRNIKILQLDCDDDFDACTFLNNGSPVIAINKRFPGDRQRFSIAHEIGHIILDVHKIDQVEKAANRFAGALILPDEAIFMELGKKRSSISLKEIYLIKQKFGISMQAILFRAKDLAIISENQYKIIIKEFSIKGYRREEPGEAYPQEEPKRMDKLVLRLLSEDIISRSRAEELYDGKILELGGIAEM